MKEKPKIEQPKEEEEKKEPEKKQKTIAELKEKIERLQSAYAPLGWFHKKPLVKDLGYYANEAKIKELKKQIKELEKERRKKGEGAIVGEKKEKIKKEIKEPKILSKEEPEELTTEEQFKIVDKNLRSIYGKIGYRKRKIREGGVLGRAKLEKEIANLEKQRDKLKKIKKKIKERLIIDL